MSFFLVSSRGTVVGIVEAPTISKAAAKLGKRIAADRRPIGGMMELDDGYAIKDALVITESIENTIKKASRVEVDIRWDGLTRTVEIEPTVVRLQVNFKACASCDECCAAMATAKREIEASKVAHVWETRGRETWLVIDRRDGEEPLDTIQRALGRKGQFFLAA